MAKSEHSSLSDKAENLPLRTLAVTALGVVYGDIGTSPLYALKTAFDPQHGLALNPANLLGVVSLIIWSLLVVVTLKYVVLILRADNHGEGGIMALLALTISYFKGKGRVRNMLLVLGVFGASLFYGDSIITPAISVLSAVEGLSVATAFFNPYVIPATIVILVALFVLQSRGTAIIGGIFGPIMVLWFIIIAVTGVMQIAAHPEILKAINPLYALNFLLTQRWIAFLALGSVVLALTGAEALYADLGHFGRRPIRLTWTCLVLPALALSYLGQGGLLLANPKAIDNPFYLAFPDWALYPMVALATIATVIASQSVISGAYSMTKQAMQLGFLPRMKIIYTSEKEVGQIYMPFVNYALMIAVVAVVLAFHSSARLGAAYGAAVSGTMVLTTILTFFCIHYGWRYRLLPSLAATAVFLIIDLAFFTSNLLKFVDGAWFPLAIGFTIFLIMTTWHHGRELLFDKTHHNALPLRDFLLNLFKDPPHRVPGTAVFLARDEKMVPVALIHNLKHNHVLHDKVIFVSVSIEEVPTIPRPEQVTVTPLEENCFMVSLRYGFKDDAKLPQMLASVTELAIDQQPTSYFVGREDLIISHKGGMMTWRKILFIDMFRNARSTAEYFFLPPNQVVELGMQVEL